MSHSRSSHLFRGCAILLLAGLAYVMLRAAVIPESFGEYGHYRAAALDEIAAQRPMFQGRDACYECHDDIVDLVNKDTHHSVNCEDCHGPAWKHVAYQMGEDDEGISEEDAVLPMIKDRSLCLLCHRRLQARPRSFPQIDPATHIELQCGEDAQVDCIECHSPHEPIFLLTDTSSARIHPVISECFHCHDPVPEQPLEEVDDHPPVFLCNHCHEDLSTDFEQRSHSALACGICHQFTKVTDTAGRIFKNGNDRFCLLCHEEKPFKGAGTVPLVAWPAHLDEEDVAEADRDKTCVECHWEMIHSMSWGDADGGAGR